MSADDKCPPWVRVSTFDMDTNGGRYVLGGKTTKEWADYGRWFALQQRIARSPEGYIDVATPRAFRALAYDFSLSDKACKAWLETLVEAGFLDAESYEAGRIFSADVWNSIQAYQTQVRANRRNGRKGGRPRKNATQTNNPPDIDGTQNAPT